MAHEMLDVDRLRIITSEIIVALISPPFVEAMRTMRSTPEHERLRVAAQILSTEALRSKGVPLPADMRITSRYFETGVQTIEVSDSPEVGQRPLAKAVRDEGGSGVANPRPRWGGCAFGGGASVCGGAGGWTVE